MNQRLKLQLAGYVDDGMDYSNSAEVRDIVDALVVQAKTTEKIIHVLGLGNIELEGSDSLDNPKAVLN